MNEVLMEASPSQFHMLMSSGEEKRDTIVGSLLVDRYHGEFEEAAALPLRVTIVRNRVRASDHRVAIPVPEFQLNSGQRVYVCNPGFIADLERYGLAFNHTILGEFSMPSDTQLDLLFERFLPPAERSSFLEQKAVTRSLYFTATPSAPIKIRKAIFSFLESYLTEGFDISEEEGRKRQDELESTSLTSSSLRNYPDNPLETDYLKLIQ